jgi:hypothetical protein
MSLFGTTTTSCLAPEMFNDCSMNEFIKLVNGKFKMIVTDYECVESLLDEII